MIISITKKMMIRQRVRRTVKRTETIQTAKRVVVRANLRDAAEADRTIKTEINHKSKNGVISSGEYNGLRRKIAITNRR